MCKFVCMLALSTAYGPPVFILHMHVSMHIRVCEWTWMPALSTARGPPLFILLVRVYVHI